MYARLCDRAKRSRKPSRLLSFTVPGRPITFNATSKSSHWPASKEIAQWREDFAWVAKASRKKQTEFPVIVHVRQTYAKGRDKDAVSDFLAHKGGQDGLVDAGVMPDDGPTYVI